MAFFQIRGPDLYIVTDTGQNQWFTFADKTRLYIFKSQGAKCERCFLLLGWAKNWIDAVGNKLTIYFTANISFAHNIAFSLKNIYSHNIITRKCFMFLFSFFSGCRYLEWLHCKWKFRVHIKCFFRITNFWRRYFFFFFFFGLLQFQKVEKDTKLKSYQWTGWLAFFNCYHMILDLSLSLKIDKWIDQNIQKLLVVKEHSIGRQHLQI